VTAEVISTAQATQDGRRLGPQRSGRRSALLKISRFVRMIPLVPAIIIMVVFLAGPIIWSFYGSLTNAALSGANAANSSFIGFDNYVKLFNDPVFPQSLWITIVFTLASAVISQNVLGLGIALVVTRANKKLATIVSSTVVGAWILPEIVAAFVCYAYFSQDGTLNQILALAGLTGPNWLYTFPLLAVVLANLWRGTAFSLLVYQAALNDVPPEISEAAMIDGAGGAKRLFFVTIPMIKNTITTNLMLITLQTLSVFTLIYVMTSGGPGNDSTTLPILAYKEAFRFGNIGYGTAIATILLLIGAIFSIIYIRAARPSKD